MGLSLYNSDQDLFSKSDVMKTTYNGRIGTVTNTKLYIRNNNGAYFFQNIQVTPQQYIGGWTVPALAGWTIKLKAGEQQPTEAEWDLIDPNDPVSLSDLGETGSADTTTYRPFWVRIYCPPGTPAQVLDQFRLHITYLRRNV